MHDIIMIYLIISLYLCIGYIIHNSCVREIQKDSYYGNIYNTLSNNSKRLLMVLLMVVWLPIIIGELVVMLVEWIAKNYDA